LTRLRKPAPGENRPIEFGAASLSAEDRLKARIDQLSNMARLPAAESQGAPPAAEILADPVLRESFSDAARETEDLQKELERLDAEWTRKLEELGQEKPGETDPVRPGAVANVISLANRIRALRKDIAK
jgi:HAMP domain-containing protein